jgi:hypothetical protein
MVVAISLATFAALVFHLSQKQLLSVVKYWLSQDSKNKEMLDFIDKEIEVIRVRNSSHIQKNSAVKEFFVLLEKALELGLSHEKLSEAMRAYALDHDTITLIHRKPDGELIRIKNAKIVSKEPLTLYRELKPGGIYDGLGMPIEAGDYAITYVYDDRYLIHEYYSKQGTLKGVYANVNTPPEYLPGAIRYTDLYVDVVRKPGEEPKIIDIEELDRRYDQGVITSALRDKALSVAKKLFEELKARTPRCFPPHKPRARPRIRASLRPLRVSRTPLGAYP